MTKAKTAKYPTLRVRVSQDMYDFAYTDGWPKSIKAELKRKMDKQNEQHSKSNKKSIKTSAITANK